MDRRARLRLALLLGLGGCALVGPARPPVDDLGRIERIESMYGVMSLRFARVPELTVEEFRTMQQNRDLVLVDVREPAEREVSMIPSAISQAEFEANPERYADLPVVTYCTIGYRSGLYAKSLHSDGFEVYNLAGSLLSWTHMGGELTDADGPTRRVHVYSERFNIIAKGYEAVW